MKGSRLWHMTDKTMPTVRDKEDEEIHFLIQDIVAPKNSEIEILCPWIVRPWQEGSEHLTEKTY